MQRKSQKSIKKTEGSRGQSQMFTFDFAIKYGLSILRVK